MKREFIYQISESDLFATNSSTTISQFLSSKGYSAHILTYLRHHDGTVLLNGNPSLLKSTITSGDKLQIILEEFSNNKVLPIMYEGEPFSIEYEDEDIIVVNKPAGMPIHPSRGSYENTLGNAIAAYYEAQGESMVFRCINRLDKNTSGLTIIAKNMLSATLLYEQMVSRNIKRTYTAIVENNSESSLAKNNTLFNVFTTGESGTVNAPIEREQAESIKRCVDFIYGKMAITHYSVLNSNDKAALIQLHLDTGRTHQIRVHMAYLGHPLLGDNIYNPEFNSALISRHALHAGNLEFSHPISGKKLAFSADIPQDIQTCVQTLNMV